MGYQPSTKVDRDKTEISTAQLLKCYPTWYLADCFHAYIRHSEPSLGIPRAVTNTVRFMGMP